MAWWLFSRDCHSTKPFLSHCQVTKLLKKIILKKQALYSVVMPENGLVNCVIPENIHTPPTDGEWKFLGCGEGGGAKGYKFPRGMGGAHKNNFPQG